MWKEFKEFISRGNVIDMAVGIIIGAAFGGVVSSLVNDIIMPPIGMVLGRVDFKNLYFSLDGQNHGSLAQAQQSGAPVIAYGAFINTVIDFLIVAFIIFLLVRAFNRLQRDPKTDQHAPTTKDCPYCKMSIPKDATRCPDCTSRLDGGDGHEQQAEKQHATVDVNIHTLDH